MTAKEKKLNVCHNYFEDGTSICEVHYQLEEGIDRNIYTGISTSLLKLAKHDVDQKVKSLDKFSHVFAQHLFYLLPDSLESKLQTVDRNQMHAFMVIDATYFGKTSERVQIGEDLGNNPFILYKKHAAPTKDEAITTDCLGRFNRENLTYLVERGFMHALVNSSRIYWMREEDTKPFLKNDRLNMVEVIPFVSGAPANVHFQKPYIPTDKEYEELAFDFLSCRLKERPNEKVILRCVQPREDYFGMIDWLGYRVVLEDKEKVDALVARLTSKESQQVMKIDILKFDNYYDNRRTTRKKSKRREDKTERSLIHKAFKDIGGYRLVLSVLPSKSSDERIVVEFQAMDRLNFYRREITSDSPASRVRYEAEKDRTLALLNPVCRSYKQNVLDPIYGKGLIVPVL